MTAVPAHELTRVVICKEFGCENECRVPLIDRAPYANLCDEHYQAMREKMSRTQLERRGLTGAPPPVAEPSRNGHAGKTGSLKDAAQACVQPAGDLDKALTRKSAADSDVERARSTLAEALRNLQAAVQGASA